jgi:Xaa-Pro aminopeptidase
MTVARRGSRDEERMARIRQALGDAGLDAVICTLPLNVLLLTGYWPVVGTAIALATREGEVGLAAPEDERELALAGWAEPIHCFQPGSVSELLTTPGAVRHALGDCFHALGISGGRIGWEAGSTFVPVSYASINLYGNSLVELCRDLLPGGRLNSADDMLRRLRAVPTAAERKRIRDACAVAGRAFADLEPLQPGMSEAQVAAGLRSRLLLEGTTGSAMRRADGFAWCMSGPNSAMAYGSYARTSSRTLAPGDLVLVHCNSYVDGFWTDITRTYTVGPPSERQERLYCAVFAARQAALGAIRPGAAAAEVDRAARAALRAFGLDDAFRHPTGHGVGFGAIDHHALPRLHAASPDVLETGMAFNVEPAVYFESEGGVRHCDMVAVVEEGAEVLTAYRDLDR